MAAKTTPNERYLLQLKGARQSPAIAGYSEFCAWGLGCDPAGRNAFRISIASAVDYYSAASDDFPIDDPPPPKAIDAPSPEEPAAEAELMQRRASF